jgi:uncharacterized protein
MFPLTMMVSTMHIININSICLKHFAIMGDTEPMKPKLTFLLVLTLLFLFSGSVYGDDYQDGLDALLRGDFETAEKLWLPLAEQGNLIAQTTLGVIYYQEKEYKKAIRLLRLAAEQGNSEAQYNLGNGYLRGKGVPQDDKEAVRLYRLSAEQGHASAQYNLGLMYHQGKGVPQDYKEGVKWHRLSAEQGDADAQFNLGMKYYEGQGVPQDYVSAHMWFNLSGSNGHEGGVKSRDIIEKRMSPSQLEKAQEMARNWKPKK